MKTLLVVDDGSSVTFYCRCGRQAREAPRDDYQTGIEFYCRKHGWVATWRITETPQEPRTAPKPLGADK